PEEARVVQQIFRWIAHERLSMQEVSRRLQKQGIKSPAGRNHWNVGTLSYLLKNPAYQGQAGYGKSRVIERLPQLRPQRGPAAAHRGGHVWQAVCRWLQQASRWAAGRRRRTSVSPEPCSHSPSLAARSA